MPRSFDKARLVLCEPNQAVRSALRMALFSKGYRTIADAPGFVKVHDLLEQDSVDLLITSGEIENNDVGFLVEEMRNQRLGTNPFVLVIMLLATADPAEVKKAIDRGIDDLLLMPVSPNTLLARVEKLSTARKPFVATHDYTGPDRRNASRPFQQAAPTLAPPNPLAARIRDGADGTRLEAEIRAAAATLNQIKIGRHAAQAEWLASQISALIRDGAGDPATLAAHAARLPLAAEDMLRRVKGTPAEAHRAAIEQLLELARQLEPQPSAMSAAGLEKLRGVTKALAGTLISPGG